MIFVFTIVLLSYSTVSSNSFGTIKIITTKDFCSLSDQNCVDKKCNYFDKCPLPFDHKCGKNICARNQTDCEMYLNAKFHFNRLRTVNVLNATFHIWHSGKFDLFLINNSV